MVSAAVSGLWVGVHSNKSEGEKMSVERLVGLIVAFVGLTLLAPVLVLVAMGVRLNSSGAAIVRATRRRDDGSSFSFVRFRTNDPNSNQATIFGRFLRRHSLDQLPALASLLTGKITLRDLWNLARETAA